MMLAEQLQNGTQLQTWTTTRHTSIQVMDSVLLTWYIIAHEGWVLFFEYINESIG